MTLPPALDVRPARSTNRPGAEVTLLVDSSWATSATVTVSHLGQPLPAVTAPLIAGRTAVSLGALPEGSYAVSVTTPLGGVATTAFDVLSDRNARPRYGFLADFSPGRTDASEIADHQRAFQLTQVQFYDWMYRHAELLPPTDEFTDALGRPQSLSTVRALIAATHEAGAQAIAYAAVYGAGVDYALAHPDQLVSHADGTPWTLADFLWIADLRPESPWTRHLEDQMVRAVHGAGFDGLHLDQYGDPKLAVAADGEVVDYAKCFAAYIERIRGALPEATLIFNNVNDFPTLVTAAAPQDATYIEVWSPHDTYADLVDLVRRARAWAPHRPVILAAYLTPFARACEEAELATAILALTTVWAEGGQSLLFGERGGILVDPYYPKFATLTDQAIGTLRRYLDFAVACGDLLCDGSFTWATSHLLSGINQDLAVTGHQISLEPDPGSLWVRASTKGRLLVIQMVDFRDQASPRWDEPRQPLRPCVGMAIRVRVASREVTALFGHPEAGPDLHPVSVTMDGEYAVIALPEFTAWCVLVLDR